MSVDVEATAVAINGAVKIVRDGAVGWVVLTRPGQINAINDDENNSLLLIAITEKRTQEEIDFLVHCLGEFN